MKKIGTSQQKILDYLKECSSVGRTPSVREICDEVGLKSTSTVHHHLSVLEEQGYITREHGVNRCIHISGEVKADSVALIGTVAAGYPILAFEEITDYIPIPDTIKRNKELFALKVKGESMINAGILDGDVVVLEKTPVAENGEIVVALVEDEATLKRFYKENGHFRLQPENDSFEPIIVDNVSILGKLVYLVRDYI